MGLLDKAKFWKKKEDDFGDLSNLGDFGLEDKSGAAGGLGGGLGGLGDPGMEDKPLDMHGMPVQREEVQPSPASMDMGNQLGINTPQPARAQQTFQAPAQQQYQQPAPQYQQQGPELRDIAKDIEIIHAKLDAIKSSLDSVNQRLATLERMAGGEQKRYTW